MTRRKDWKLIHYFEDDRDELYDLETDPGEQNDILSEQAGVATAMRDRLDSWLVETDAKLPTPDPEYDSAKESERLHHLEHTFMQELEEQHAAYLDPDWQPNDDWWGSMVVVD